MERRFIESDRDAPPGQPQWKLCVERDDSPDTATNDGAPYVVARKMVPYDGVFSFSSADRPSHPTRRSEHGLDERDVVRRYCTHSESVTPFETLVDAVQAALADLRGEGVEA